MKKTVSYYEFVDVMRDEYTLEGIDGLWGYFENYEAETDDEIELDRIGIRCEFDEYATVMEAIESYDLLDEADDIKHYNGLDNDEEKKAFLLEMLQNYTETIELINGGVIIKAF